MPESSKQAVRAHARDGRVVWTGDPVEVMPGIIVTGQIPRNTDFEDVGGTFYLDKQCETADILPDDQAVFLDTPRGLVVLLGCSHSGVVSTMDYIAKLSGGREIDSVVGGMHLLNASRDRIERTVSAFVRYDVQHIGISHCTGSEAARAISTAMPDRCFLCSTGSRVRL
jgi:7,8-dihydropterin-6-yl-methyl-4-(beta-D-ribofuranosyl)aminobenzene 5'-phosphate synthase